MKTNSKNCKDFFEEKLNRIPLNKLSKQSKFSKRRARKITAKAFLHGFFIMISNKDNNSYQNWAIKISWLIKKKVSKQALWKKMHKGQIEFLRRVLKEVMKDKVIGKFDEVVNSTLGVFSDIIVEDSTHIKLNDKLYKDYPGNGYWDKKAKKAVMKIQAAYSITRKKFIKLDITSFRENDQSYSPKIVDSVKRGALVIRDLGYFVLKTFRRLNEKGIYYISRMRKDVSVISPQEEVVIDLAKMLKKKGSLDIDVFLGQEERVPMRLIAVPVSEETANSRRRKAKNDRDYRTNHSKKYLYLLGWELFITNVSNDKLSAKDIVKLYYIRWRIESIFKSWKSFLRITEIPQNANLIRTESYIYCILIFIVLFQVHFYKYILQNKKTSKEISMLKLMQFIALNIEYLFLSNMNQRLLVAQFEYYCKYETRHDRKNFCQYLYN